MSVVTNLILAAPAGALAYRGDDNDWKFTKAGEHIRAWCLGLTGDETREWVTNRRLR